MITPSTSVVWCLWHAAPHHALALHRSRRNEWALGARCDVHPASSAEQSMNQEQQVNNMTVNVPLDRGPEFVNWLAQHLTDLEFELLLRKRITVQYERAKEHRPEIYDGTTYIYYRHSIND